MRVYTVMFHKNTEGGLFGIDYGPDGYDEFSDYDERGREVYTVYSEYDIDRILDLRAQVASYSLVRGLSPGKHIRSPLLYGGGGMGLGLLVPHRAD